jgi:anti-sigma factor RsiW
MHLSIDDLLSVRDGEASAEAAAHAASCPECIAELARLRRVRDELAALPGQAPEHDLWPALREAASARQQHHRWVQAGWAAAAVAVVFTLVMGVRGGLEAWQETQLAHKTRALVAESQKLEQTLRTVEGGGRVVSGRTASTIAHLQDRIALIDTEINRAGGARVSSQDVLKLWQERVQLLDTLVNVQATRTAYVGL